MPEKGRYVKDRQHQEDLISGKATWNEELEETVVTPSGGPKVAPVITPPNQVSQLQENLKTINTPDTKNIQVDMSARDAAYETYNAQQKAAKKQERADKWNSFKSSVGSALGSEGAQKVYSGIGAASDLASSFIKADEDSSFKQQQAVGDALMKSGNPYAMAAGAAFKGLSVMDQALGINVNTISKNQASAAGISGAERVLNNVLGFLPGTGAGLLAGKTDEALAMTEETKSLSNAFAGSVSDIGTAESMGGKRYLFGKGKVNNLIREANENNMLLTDISMTNTQRKQSNYGQDIAQQNMNRFAGKTGMKLLSIEECRRILKARKEPEVQAFHNGGVIGVDVNVIPEGKYHAHLNHLEELSPEFENLTKKGIPVVAKESGGEIEGPEQFAEIEKYEIIFRLEVTERLEELFADGSDEAMIEAGKLVTEELLRNTQDNTGEMLDDGKEEN